MNHNISAWVEDAVSISHGKQKGKGVRAESGPYPRSRLRWFSKAQPLIKWAVPLLLALAPLVAQAQLALDGFDPGANGAVLALAVQAGGKVLVVGGFTTLGGGGTDTITR